MTTRNVLKWTQIITCHVVQCDPYRQGVVGIRLEVRRNVRAVLVKAHGRAAGRLRDVERAERVPEPTP